MEAAGPVRLSGAVVTVSPGRQGSQAASERSDTGFHQSSGRDATRHSGAEPLSRLAPPPQDPPATARQGRGEEQRVPRPQGTPRSPGAPSGPSPDAPRKRRGRGPGKGQGPGDLSGTRGGRPTHLRRGPRGPLRAPSRGLGQQQVQQAQRLRAAVGGRRCLRGRGRVCGHRRNRRARAVLGSRGAVGPPPPLHPEAPAAAAAHGAGEHAGPRRGRGRCGGDRVGGPTRNEVRPGSRTGRAARDGVQRRQGCNRYQGMVRS